MNLIIALIAVALLILAAAYLFPLRIGPLLIAAERRRNGVRSRCINIDDGTWHYLEAGRGTTLLALHGIAADADHWTRLAGLLRRSFHIIAPDLPGFGLSSSPPNAAYSIDDQVAGLHTFVTALGLESFVLAGNSMGGQLAAAYAASFPEHVSGLCLLAPSGIMGARFSPVTKAAVNEEHNPLVVNTSADFDALINTCFYHKPFIPWPVRKMLLVRAKKLAGNTAAAFDDVRFYSNSLEKIAAAVLTPCLILWGRNDQVLDVSGASILDEILAHSKLVLLDKTGHLPMLEDPATCATLIQDFVAGPDLVGNNLSS